MTEKIRVFAFKLSSGEELISRVIKRTEDEIVLDRPNMIGLAPAQGGMGISIQLMPWMASNQDGEITVKRSHIIAETKPNEELEKGYLSRTSGIALV